MSILFISDLHLSEDRPDITERLVSLLEGYSGRTEALYILGDLFEAYVGDDDDAPLVRNVEKQLRAFSNRGSDVFFMHGNRDFLVGQDFAERAGLTILADPTRIELAGKPTLLMHGDSLCTDDAAYQAFRAEVRSPQWQQTFLAQPLAARKAFAEQARQQSQQHTASVSETIMDVNQRAVEDTFVKHGLRRIIHGHTHRPNWHHYAANCERIVLGDWFDQASMLVVDDDELSLYPEPASS